jgi:hypothetical protein
MHKKKAALVESAISQRRQHQSGKEFYGKQGGIQAR